MTRVMIWWAARPYWARVALKLALALLLAATLKGP